MKSYNDSLPLGFDDVVYIGGRGTRRITCFAFVMLTILGTSGVVFLCLTFVKSSDYIVLRRYCLEFSADKVFPGPSPFAGDPTAYVNGPMSFHRTEPYIEWDLYHSIIPSIGSLDIIGPVDVDNPYNGPLYLRLCETGSEAPCLLPSPYNMKQRITSVPITGQPLDDLVDRIVDKPHHYKLVLNTAFPNGTLLAVFVASLDQLC